MKDADVKIDLPGWPLVIGKPDRKVFESGDGYRLIVNVRDKTTEITIKEVDHDA